MLLAMGVDAQTLAALRSDLNRHGEESPVEVADVALLVARLSDSAELVVLGSDVDDPLAAAQRVRLVDAEVDIACLVAATHVEKLTEAARITPFLGKGIIVLAAGPGASSRLRPLLLASRKRAAHRATLAAMNLALPPAPQHARATEYLDRLMAHLPLGVLVLDAEGVVRAANPRAGELLGLPSIGAEDPRFEDLFSPGELPSPIPEGSAFLVKCESPAGTRHLEVIAATPRGSNAGRLVILQDVTDRVVQDAELRAARRELAQNEKLSALGTLVAGVAHEVRTPLAYIANSAEVLARLVERLEDRTLTEEDRQNAREMATAIADGVQRIDRLVRELRRFVRTDPGEQGLHALDRVAAEAAALFQAAGRRSAEVRLDLQPTGPVLLDPIQFQQVVINLLDNAADAMGGGGIIDLSTRRVEGGVELVVADHGPGVPEALRERIFDPLFTTKREGTGLGLAIVQRIVTAHGGRIHVENGPTGARFCVFVPAPRAQRERLSGP